MAFGFVGEHSEVFGLSFVAFRESTEKVDVGINQAVGSDGSPTTGVKDSVEQSQKDHTGHTDFGGEVGPVHCMLAL